MNRIRPMTGLPVPPYALRSEAAQGVARSQRRDGVQYALFAPLHYEPNYAYPLVIWLHGSGDDEAQLRRVMPEISMRNYVGVAPRGVLLDRKPSRRFGWPQSPESISESERAIFAALDAARERLHVDGRRVFLAGYRSGGTMALRVGLQHPAAFSGLISIGGGFPCGLAPLAQLSAARRLPLLLAQGREAREYPVERMCDDLRLLHAAGMHLTLRQYPLGDELAVEMLHDANAWIMEQVTGSAS